ncbi:restriction endonuclease subunit S [Thiothrix lacustris]|uniref:restriction endonuclease subunit S n=1 Tax=Thiothrix lacustris TaxID=525917 RepID=UPI000686D353|nr:restriction endonuclease subunit S [Thiothrix lacustris]
MANARLAITPKNHKGNRVNQLSPKETKNPLPNPDKGVSQDLNVSKKIPLNPPFSKGEAGEHLEQSSGHIVLPPSFAKGGVGGGFSSSSQLPPGWTVLSCGDAFDQISTTKAKIKTKDTLSEGLFPVVDQGLNFIAGYIDDEDKVLDVDEPVCVFGDHTRIIKWVDFSFVPGADGTKVLTPKKHIHPRFFYYQLKSLKIVDRGYSRHFKYLKESVFVLAPLPEQIRIANKLDSILAKVDNAQARLEKIPTLLKRFRQAVLAAATSGELTREWREERSLSSIKNILENSRLQHWKNIQLDEFEKKKITPKSNEWMSKYKPIRYVGKLKGIPDEWLIERLDFIADVIDPNPKHRNPKYHESGYLFISTAQFSGVDDFDFSTCRYVAEETILEQKERCRFDERSIAFSRKGTIGHTRILDVEFKFALLDSLCVINCDENLSEKFINYVLRSSVVHVQVLEKTKGVALKQISVGGVRELLIPIPSLEEQGEIVRRVESLFALADSVEKQYKAAKQRLDRLTQAVLAKAFRGELVPQDPDDEPAAELLKRIQAQRTQQQTGKKRHAAS